ncbi:MAG TPA: hypothetical protein DEF78_06220 [Sphingobacterium sp.]|nr:hypothetical protein [Sphingobacterium sp.]
MTDKRRLEILEKRYPEINAEILASDAGEVDELLVEIAWFFSQIYEHRTNIFICACLLKYSPNTIDNSSRVVHGLVSAMANAKNVSKGAISQKIKSAVFQYEHYADIADKANIVVDKLNNIVWEK